MSLNRIAVVVCISGLVFAAGCRTKKHRVSEDTPVDTEKKVLTLLEKYPSNDAVPGSKSYPLRIITTENLLARTKEGGASSSWPFALVDARTRVEYEAEHIPGAVNCPAEQVEQKLASVVTDKSKEVVFYCNGPDCTKSHKAGRSAIASGFPKAVVYDDGLPAWKKAGHPVGGTPLPKVEIAKLDPQALATALKAKGITVVDIRPRDEFLVFRITGAVNVELDELESKLKDQVKPATPLCLADYTGKQQDIAARLLTKVGYTNVKILEGGMRAWQAANLPIDKGLDAATAKGAGNPKSAVEPAKDATKAPPTPTKPLPPKS